MREQDDSLNIGQAAKILNVAVNTMQRWDRIGKFKARRHPASNRRYYLRSDIDAFMGIKHDGLNKTVIYARVSTPAQKPDLLNQIESDLAYAASKGYSVSDTVSEIGGGMNYSRPKWNKLLNEVEDRNVSLIIVSYKDRFTRFGYDWFERYCSRFGCRIEVVNDVKTSPEEEMTNDLMSIIHCFSSRLYGLRRYKRKGDLLNDIPENQDISNT